MHRFFISEEDRIGGGEVVILSDELVHQMFYVLRFKEGEKVVILDGSGDEYEVELSDFSKNEIRGKILKKLKNDTEPEIKVCLYQSVLKNQERFEWVLQKGTEVGVNEFVPLITERTERVGLWKIERLNRILREAAEQSGRGIVPELKDVVKFEDLFKKVGLKGELNIIVDPNAGKVLKEIVLDLNFKKCKKINIFIGPEGGFTKNEVSKALRKGFTGVNLGKRILRSETAGVIVSALILLK